MREESCNINVGILQLRVLSLKNTTTCMFHTYLTVAGMESVFHRLE